MKNVGEWRRRGLIGLIVVAMVVGLYFGFRPRPVLVDMGTVSRGPMRVSLEQEGRTRVIDRYVVSAPVAGYARRIGLDVGAAVLPGMPLVALEPARAEVLDARSRAAAEARVAAATSAVGAADQRLRAARAGAALAGAALRRAEALRAAGHVSVAAVDEARAASDQAAAEQRSAEFGVATAGHELEAARTALGYAAAGGRGAPVLVKSPVAGQVLRIPRKSEGPVAAGQALVEVGDPRGLEVEVDVLSADAVRLGPGTRVLFERWGGEGLLEGVVRVVEPSGFTKVSALGVEEQRVWVIVAFSSPPAQWQRLGDAYRVEARFVLWEAADVLQIPAGSLFRDGGEWAAFVIEDGRAVKRRVKIGQRNGTVAELLDGAKEGEQVIAHPDDRLREGVRVQTR